MIITKEYEQMINIDCEYITMMFSNDFDNILLSILKDKFEGRCLNTGLILEITHIVRRSQIEIMKSTTTGGGVISVVFSTQSIICERGAIIVDAQILRVNERQILVAQTDTAFIRIFGIPQFRGLSSDDYIMVKVAHSIYTSNSKRITLITNIFVPETQDVVYIGHDSEITDEMISTLQSFIQEINDMRTVLRSIDKNITNFFAQLFYPFKIMKKVTGTKNLLDIADEFIKDPTMEMMIQTTPNINLLTGNVKTIPQPDAEDIVERSKYLILVELLTWYKTNIQMICDLAEKYPTQDAINKNKKVWNMYNRVVKSTKV